MTKYYIDVENNYIGAFSMLPVDYVEPDHPDVPINAVEVPNPPEDGRQKWTGEGWGSKPVDVDPQLEFESAIAAATTIAGLKAALLGTGGTAKAKGGSK